MQRLKGVYKGERAAVIFGGPSLIEQQVDLGVLRKKGYIVFLDSQALTPYFLTFGIEPDYFLMLFPEKSKGHGLHNFIFRSFLAHFDIRPCLKRSYISIWNEMHTHVERYLEPWKLNKGPHKRYRWKPNVYLPDSPCDLLRRIPATKILAERKLLAHYFPEFPYPNPCHVFEQSPESEVFDVERYYTLMEENSHVVVRSTNFLNSAAIALYPLLRFMGFQEVYLLGMDMSMLGSMEYAALYTFRSMLHFWWYFSRTKHVFNANYRPNRPYYFRPQKEFDDARTVLNSRTMTCIRVYQPSKYAAPLDGILTMSLKEFLNH